MRVVASLATMPGREVAALAAIASLAPQVSRVNVCLNGHRDKLPIYWENVETFRNIVNVGDQAKFHWADTGYVRGADFHFVCDDDIIYPSDYVGEMIDHMEEHGEDIAGLHGVILMPQALPQPRRRGRMPQYLNGVLISEPSGGPSQAEPWLPLNSYYRQRRVFHCTQALTERVPVHILGTSSCAYRPAKLEVHESFFKKPNMGDIWFGILAQQQRVQMWCVPRPANWITLHKEIAPGTTIFEQMKAGGDGEPTGVVNMIRPWEIFESAS